jgi:hypothetical protein
MFEFISLGIAIISVVAAIFFGFRGQILVKKNTILQKRLVEIEEARELERKKATSQGQLTARIQNYGQYNYRLLIENSGDAAAHDINLIMDGKPFDQHPAAVNGDGEITSIGPHSQATRLLAITMGCAPPFELEISWVDDSGEMGHYQTTLTF